MSFYQIDGYHILDRRYLFETPGNWFNGRGLPRLKPERWGVELHFNPELKPGAMRGAMVMVKNDGMELNDGGLSIKNEITKKNIPNHIGLAPCLSSGLSGCTATPFPGLSPTRGDLGRGQNNVILSD